MTEGGQPSARAALGAGLLGGAAVLAGITLLSRATGFGRWLVYSHSVSAQCVGQAYSTANQLPNVLFEVVAGGALAGAVVPLLAGPLARARSSDPAARDEADRIASALLTWTVLVLVPCSILLALLAGPFVRLMGIDGSCVGAAGLAARMLVVFSPQVVMYGLVAVLTGVLHAHRRFIWAAIGPLLSSVVVILAYLMFAQTAAGARDDAATLPVTAERWLAWGTTAGVLAMLAPLLLPLRGVGVRLRPTLRFPDGVARRARALAVAGVVTLLAQQASVVTMVVLANRQGNTATLNVFQYAQAVYLLPYALLAVPLATTAFPRLATHAATGERDRFARASAQTTQLVLITALAGAAVLVAVAGPVTDFFAVLDSGDVSAMQGTLVGMAPGLIGFALIAHVGRALYALERGRVAALATSSGWLVVVVAMSVLAPAAGDRAQVAPALGAASGLGMTCAGVALLLALRAAAGPDSVAGVARTILGSGVAAVAAAALGWWVAGRLGDAWGSSLGAALGSGLAAAVVVMVVLAAGVAVLDRPALGAVRELRRSSEHDSGQVVR